MQNPSLPYTDQLTGLAIGEGGLLGQNYTGPYISDGKFQESVEFGESEALDYLDYLSRMHDSAYAKYSDPEHREAADMLYAREAKRIKGLFPQLASTAVGAGNYAARKALSYYSPASMVGAAALKAGFGTLQGGLIGLTIQGVRNILQMNQMVNGTYRKKEMDEVDAFYKTDPHRAKYLDKFSEEMLSGVNRSSDLAKEIAKIKKGKADREALGNALGRTTNGILDEVKRRQKEADLTRMRESVERGAAGLMDHVKALAAQAKQKAMPSKVSPTADELTASQAARWTKFQQLYVDAEASKHAKRKKKKRQKPNVKRAVKILPHLYM